VIFARAARRLSDIPLAVTVELVVITIWNRVFLPGLLIPQTNVRCISVIVALMPPNLALMISLQASWRCNNW
jgi:hypothetical protein